MSAEFDFASARAEVEAELAAALSRLPDLERAYKDAFRGREDGQAR